MKKINFTRPDFKKIGKNIAAALATCIEIVCVLAGVVLIAYGFWDWFRPLSFILPGAILVYIGLPSNDNAGPT